MLKSLCNLIGRLCLNFACFYFNRWIFMRIDRAIELKPSLNFTAMWANYIVYGFACI